MCFFILFIMTSKKKEDINQEPILRFVNKTSLDDFIDILLCEKRKGELNGYSDLELQFIATDGIFDVYLSGYRDFTPTEMKEIERFHVICRVKNKTSDGLMRDDLLK